VAAVARHDAETESSAAESSAAESAGEETE